MTFRFKCVACLLSLVLGLGCNKTQEPAPQDSVRIGFLASGDRASYADAARVAIDEFNRGDTVFEEQLARIAAARPEAFLISGLAQDVALVARQSRALPLQNASGEPALFLGADAWDNQALLESATLEVEGSYFTSHFSSHTR